MQEVKWTTTHKYPLRGVGIHHSARGPGLISNVSPSDPIFGTHPAPRTRRARTQSLLKPTTIWYSMVVIDELNSDKRSGWRSMGALRAPRRAPTAAVQHSCQRKSSGHEGHDFSRGTCGVVNIACGWRVADSAGRCGGAQRNVRFIDGQARLHFVG